MLIKCLRNINSDPAAKTPPDARRLGSGYLLPIQQHPVFRSENGVLLNSMAYSSFAQAYEHLTALFQPLTRFARSWSVIFGVKVRSMDQLRMTSSLLFQ